MTMLYLIFNKHHITPDEFYKKPPGIRAFIRASMLVYLEHRNGIND